MSDQEQTLFTPVTADDLTQEQLAFIARAIGHDRLDALELRSARMLAEDVLSIVDQSADGSAAVSTIENGLRRSMRAGVYPESRRKWRLSSYILADLEDIAMVIGLTVRKVRSGVAVRQTWIERSRTAPIEIRLAAAVRAAGALAEECAEGESADRGFDAGEFSSGEWSRAQERARRLIAHRHGLSLAQLEETRIGVGGRWIGERPTKTAPRGARRNAMIDPIVDQTAPVLRLNQDHMFTSSRVARTGQKLVRCKCGWAARLDRERPVMPAIAFHLQHPHEQAVRPMEAANTLARDLREVLRDLGVSPGRMMKVEMVLEIASRVRRNPELATGIADSPLRRQRRDQIGQCLYATLPAEVRAEQQLLDEEWELAHGMEEWEMKHGSASLEVKS